ncbi:nucleic acid-binding, OB-fold protein [Artemisia annua]|uniref:Nucleic acid-binding, OB-fold protein n=1 Tax=Artemisia annua TaxID=35608 RepID=A0A2U1MU97_ARTAN|nr:nucleic acid-binding, OB-fold protein [Artemisia annua]
MELTSEAGTASKAIAEPTIPQRSLAYFTDLNPADNTKYIEVRVYRKWIATKVPSLIATGFSCMLLDKKGSAIQANADLKEKDRFEHHLQLNCVYRIQGFGFEKTDSWGKTLDNDFTLCFGKHTRTDLLTDNDFPYHYFNFAAYNELGGRLEKKNPILTDYIGYVQNVEKVKEYGSATTNKTKVRNIAIRNLKSQQRRQLQLSATSATSYYFNPPVEETSELLTAYNENNPSIPQLGLQTKRLADWEQERARNRVPLGTLLQIDPNTQQRVLFTQDAMRLRVDTAYNWYYQKCDECGGKLDYGYIHGHCHPYGTQSKPQNSYSFRIIITDGTGNATMTCFTPHTDGLIKPVDTLLQEIDNKDPALIPPQILALQNTRHVFQFRFAKQAGKGTPTLVLQKVMDNPPAILPVPTEGPSSPPAPSPSGHASAEISPPPATPMATQDSPADTCSTMHVPTTSSVRKELFTATAAKESQPKANTPDIAAKQDSPEAKK